MASCPNIHHPDWKTLVARVGETKAYKQFIENGYEIPVIDNVTHGATYDISGLRFKSRDTLNTLENNPELAQKIVKRLKELYPDVRVFEDGLFDEEGNWKELKPGEKGMHYRNAFNSAVAWANDSYLETPPHEYAHDYIEMFRNHPTVQQAINKYGEEQLATLMGRYFAKREMSNSFQKFMQDFWNTIRSLFGSPDVADILSDNFYTGKTLEGQIHQGTGIYRYQKTHTPYKRIKGAFTVEDKYKAAVEPAKPMDDKAVLLKMKMEMEHNAYDKNLDEFDSAKLLQYLSGKIKKIRALDVKKDASGKEEGYRNTPNLDQRILREVDTTIGDASMRKNIGDKLLNKDVELSEAEQLAYDTMLNIEKRLAFKAKFDNSFADGNGSLVSMDPIVKSIKKEISDTTNRRNKLYDKIPHKKLKSTLKWVERMLRYQLNARLSAKYLSGGENTEFSNMFYHSLDQAESKRLKVSSVFSEFLTEKELSDKYKKWSHYNQQGSSIDQFETENIGVKIDGQSTTVPLTKTEMISMYLNLRQKDSSKSIRNNGFVIDDEIKGRDIKPNKTVFFDAGAATKLVESVEANPEMMSIVSKIDGALDYMYQETNDVFRQENGFDLEKIPNYFPVYTKKKGRITERTKKSNINDFRSGYARLGQDETIRVGDVMAIMNNVKNSGALYSAFSLPIQNNRKLIEQIRDDYVGEQEDVYFDAMEGLLKRLEDNSNLYSNQGEKEVSRTMNMLTSNFGVSVLAMNIPVMFKQPISYLTAMEEIDKKYLKAAGWGVGGFVGIRPKQILKSLSYTGIGKGDTKLPIEWQMDRSNPIFEEMIEHSPKMKARLDGMVSKEAGEALMNADIGKDKIKVPLWKDDKGNSVYISKARLMEGIKIFDSATVMSIWKAAKLEAAEQYPQLEKGSPEYWEHIEGRVNEIVNKTQPTYDLTNRSELSAMSNPITRVLTMFSSARSKVAMQMIDGVISYINNPSKENKAKLIKRSANILVRTSLILTAIDAIKSGVLYGMDDDELPEFVLTSTLANNLGYIYGIGTLGQLVISQMDSKPWHKTMQHPAEMLIQDYSHALAHLFKGNLSDASVKSIEAIFKTTGLPLQGEIVPKAIYKRFNE